MHPTPEEQAREENEETPSISKSGASESSSRKDTANRNGEKKKHEVVVSKLKTLKKQGTYTGQPPEEAEEDDDDEDQSDSGSDDEDQDGYPATGAPSQNFIQSNGLEAINEEDEHSERAVGRRRKSSTK